jgi:tetratricopeptide (TPR) repeat protein
LGEGDQIIVIQRFFSCRGTVSETFCSLDLDNGKARDTRARRICAKPFRRSAVTNYGDDDLPALRSFFRTAWEQYSPTTPGDARVPNETLDEAQRAFQGGKPELAVAILESHEATQSDPYALNALGVMLTRLERFDEARAVLNAAAAALDRRKAIALANLSAVHIYQRDWLAADEAARRATVVSPETPHGWINLLFVQARQRSYAELEITLSDLSAAIPDWRNHPYIRKHLIADVMPALRKHETLQMKLKQQLVT